MATSAKCACAALLLASGALAYRGPRTASRAGELRPEQGSLAAISVQKYAGDCWKKRPVRRLALNEQVAKAAVELPGAGMDPKNITPFQTVLKDGFLKVSCVKDYLLSFGDKFGDGKFSYNLGEVSNVSIVHYESIVAKEDRKPMTYEVCFEFCRTVPDMHNFGIHNGRDCYCAPFFQAMESDSTDCDAVCEGNPSQMCGGKVKTTIFSMHMCADSGSELTAANDKATKLLQNLEGLISTMHSVSSDMQSAAEHMQKAFGQLGDPIASDLMQGAKVRAGEVEKLVASKSKIASALNTATTEASGLVNASLTDAGVANKAESLTSTMGRLTADGEDAVKELDAGLAETDAPGSNASSGASKQYYPLMYFVNKTFKDSPTTCSGPAVGKPLVAASMDACAAVCDSHVETCVGFAFFAPPPSLCFLFSKFKDAKYYTGCNSSNSSAVASCMAKLSKFEGTTVKPDPSGKCPGCLKTATSSSLCPQP